MFYVSDSEAHFHAATQCAANAHDADFLDALNLTRRLELSGG